MWIIWFLWLGSVALHKLFYAEPIQSIECPTKNTSFYINNISNVANLSIGNEINAILEKGVQWRYTFQHSKSAPLLISFSSAQPNSYIRKLFFNQTANLSRLTRTDSKEIFLPCAITGKYDLILIPKHKISLRIDIFDKHPSANWPLLNRSIPIKVRFQNRIRKRQMIIKWSKSKLDIHAVHYCLVVNTKTHQKNFCKAIENSFNTTLKRQSCSQGSQLDSIWTGFMDKYKNIDYRFTNIICTGSKSHIILRGLLPYKKYYIDIFGVHTKLRNFTFLLKATTVWFNRTHPLQLFDDMLSIGKISGMSSVSVFSYKIPASATFVSKLRILIIPCGGSQIDLKILKRRQKVQLEKDIYKPSYIDLMHPNPGSRYIFRITPSNEDEVLKANKVAIGITTRKYFFMLPELPKNTTVFEIRSFRSCRSTTIAWYGSTDPRKFTYCVIVFTISSNNRSSVDHTNYCIDFGKKSVTTHPSFNTIRCLEPTKRDGEIENTPLLNLSPGESYLVYVTINLLNGKALPYESIKINVNNYCSNDLEDIFGKNGSIYDA